MLELWSKIHPIHLLSNVSSQRKFSKLGKISGRCLAVAPDLSPHYRRRLKIHRYPIRDTSYILHTYLLQGPSSQRAKQGTQAHLARVSTLGWCSIIWTAWGTVRWPFMKNDNTLGQPGFFFRNSIHSWRRALSLNLCTSKYEIITFPEDHHCCCIPAAR